VFYVGAAAVFGSDAIRLSLTPTSAGLFNF
jgi:hypothetical protein